MPVKILLVKGDTGEQSPEFVTLSRVPQINEKILISYSDESDEWTITYAVKEVIHVPFGSRQFDAAVKVIATGS